MSSEARAAANRLLAAPEIAELCDRYRVELLVMFGSAADAAQDPSDVDLAVLAEDGFDLLSFVDELYLMTEFEGFDVLDLRRAAPVPRERALVGARRLYEARSGLFANTQIAAIMERMDTEEMRRVELELMAR
jgi:predicted nucleotidyltransferase